MTIETIEQARDAIWQRSGYDRGFISDPFAGDEAARRGLARTRAMLERLGNPHAEIPLVHVAGSKGKGSTSVLIDAIARAAGLRSGRFLSPHLHDFNERFTVDDRAISDDDLVVLTRDAIAAAERVERATPELGDVTAWELSTAMALTWFARSSCDLAIIEVGMGGTLDATNVIEPVLSIITRLDLEHTAVLGETLPEIAANKAGIIKPGIPVIAADGEDEGVWVIRQRAAELHAPLKLAGRDFTTTGLHRSFTFASAATTMTDLGLALIGRHQVENAGLAISAALALETRFPVIDERAIRFGLRGASHPGRFEPFPLGNGRTLIVDGAHTPIATTALATTMTEEFPETSVVIVIGLLADKNVTGLVRPLAHLADRWIATAPNNARAMPALVVRDALEAEGQLVNTSPSIATAINHALNGREQVVLVMGSLSTAAEARSAVRSLHL